MYDPHAPKQIFPLQDYKFFVVGNIRHIPKIVVRSSEIRPHPGGAVIHGVPWSEWGNKRLFIVFNFILLFCHTQ